MVRVLHLLEHTPDFETERGIAALAKNLGADISIIRRTIGPGGDYRNALFASFLLRGTVRHDVDIVHAWGEWARIAAVSAGAKRIVFSPTEFPDPTRLSRLHHAFKATQVHIACTAQLLHEIYLAAGFPADRITLIRPGADSPGIWSSGCNASLRRELGFSDGDYVLLALGESIRAAGHRDALWTASILHVVDPSYKILLWGRGEQALSCVRLADKSRDPAVLSIAQWKLGRKVEFEELLSVADVAVLAATGPTPTLPLMLCMAAGLSIVATPTPLTQELLRDCKNAVLVERHAPRLLARSVIELREKGLGRQSSPPVARDATANLFSSKQFVRAFRRLYLAAARQGNIEVE